MTIRPFGNSEITGAALTALRALTVKFELIHQRHSLTALSLAEASAKWQAALAEENYRASEVGYCRIYQGRKLVARISYNGRVWAV
ncbi:hypothetical protein [Herbaspirillum sp. NPDC101397]|uniref:hypothetical protein n=1 Tax=Herbaspirillum sp. NPDC101397 TaxID=3364006 RepID=UPI00383A64E0